MLIRRACLLVLLLSSTRRALAQEVWPEWPSVPGQRAEAVVEDAVVNGHRSRILHIDLPGSEQDAIRSLRERLGPKILVQTIQGRQVLTTRDGDILHTVQFKPRPGDRTLATVVSTRLGKPLLSAAFVETRRLLPPESKPLSSMESDDAGRRSLLLTVSNAASAAANREQLRRGLEQIGFNLSRSESTDSGGRPTELMWLESKTEEAIVTVVDLGEQRLITIHRSRKL